MLSGVAEFVIQGITVEGALFEPYDWAQSLCNMLGTVAPDRRLIYSSYARPAMVDGVSSVVVRVSLEHADPAAFVMLKHFVAEHRLKVRSGRGSRDADGEATGPHPVLGMERRKLGQNGW